jgi:hypothetical protein
MVVHGHHPTIESARRAGAGGRSVAWTHLGKNSSPDLETEDLVPTGASSRRRSSGQSGAERDIEWPRAPAERRRCSMRARPGPTFSMLHCRHCDLPATRSVASSPPTNWIQGKDACQPRPRRRRGSIARRPTCADSPAASRPPGPPLSADMKQPATTGMWWGTPRTQEGGSARACRA